MSASNDTVDPNSIALATRSQWCTAQESTCGTLCSGSTNANTCLPSLLTFNCLCTSNSSTPGLVYYLDTLPTFICEQVYDNCITSNANDAAAQAECKTNEQTNCGHLDPSTFSNVNSNLGSSSSSSSSATTSSSQLSSSSSSGTSSAANSRSSSSSSSSSATKSDSASISTNIFTSPTSSGSGLPGSTSTTTPSPDSGLSSGAKAGIGIGVALGGLLLLGLIAFLFYSMGTKNVFKRPGKSNRSELEGNSTQPHEIGASLTPQEKEELKSRRRAAELAGSDPFANTPELNGQRGLSERAELEARRQIAPVEVA